MSVNDLRELLHAGEYPQSYADRLAAWKVREERRLREVKARFLRRIEEAYRCSGHG